MTCWPRPRKWLKRRSAKCAGCWTPTTNAPTIRPGTGARRHAMLATGKHFLGYAVTEGALNQAAFQMGMREVYEVYARPFEAAIHLAGLGSIMNSYSEYDGVSVGASRALLTELLR